MGHHDKPEADRELIERAQHDRAAFGQIYDLYVHRIYGFCVVHSASSSEAEDLTAQTFERALRAIGRYEHRGTPFSAWLFRIASNLAIDRRRQGGRFVTLGDAPLPEPTDRDHTQESPGAAVERWEEANWLLDHVETLPSDQQRVLQLRFWHEHSFAEIGSVMGRSEAAAKQLLYRAIRGLRHQMDREAEGHV